MLATHTSTKPSMSLRLNNTVVLTQEFKLLTSSQSKRDIHYW